MFCESFFKTVGEDGDYSTSHPIRVYEGSKGLLPYFKTIKDDREVWTTTGSGFEDEDYDYARTASSV
jgi:hypothetical protein